MDSRLAHAHSVERAQPEPAQRSTSRENSLAYAVAKRALDVAVSLAAVVTSAPLMLAIAVAVKLDSKGPVLFGHVRLGKSGKYFRCFKFRTMRAGAQAELLRDSELKRVYVENDFKIPLEEDPRVTWIGRFLRKTSLDELPLPGRFRVAAASGTRNAPRSSSRGSARGRSGRTSRCSPSQSRRLLHPAAPSERTSGPCWNPLIARTRGDGSARLETTWPLRKPTDLLSGGFSAPNSLLTRAG
jgi:hypothetical protein